MLISCAPIQLTSDFQEQTLLNPQPFNPIDKTVFDLQIETLSEVFFDDRSWLSYLSKSTQRQDFEELYIRFKDHPDLARSDSALRRALAFYVKHKAGPIKCDRSLERRTIHNHKHLLITDYTIPHPENRFFILHLSTGEVKKSPAAHGYGSNQGCPQQHRLSCGTRLKCQFPVRIGNTPNSGMTSKGFFLTEEPYRSSQVTFRGGSPASIGHNAIRLEGLQYGINYNARRRAVVFHRANYYSNTCSSSAGCPAIQPGLFENYKEELDGGALLYIHTFEDHNSMNNLPDCSGDYA